MVLEVFAAARSRRGDKGRNDRRFLVWIGLVGKPSSGKSPAMDPVMTILRRLEADLAIDYDQILRTWRTEMEAAKCRRAEWETEVRVATKSGTLPPLQPTDAVEPEKPPRPRLVMSDNTVEALCGVLAGQPRGVLSYRDELAGWLGSFDRYGSGSGERPFWLEAFGGRAFVMDRVKLDRPLCIPHLTVSVLGGIQPDRLVSLLMSGDDDGLAARILLTWPEPVKPCRPTASADKGAALAAFRRLLSLKMGSDDNGSPVPVVLPLTPGAVDLFEGWRQEHSIETDAATGMLAGHFGKFPGLLLRLATVLEYLWWAASDEAQPAAISEAAIAGRAALLNGYFRLMAERAYCDAAMPEGERLGATLARWILRERPEVVNARDLRRKARLPGLREAAKVKLALDALEEASWLRPKPSREGGAAGRQRTGYEVSPRLWEERHG